MRRNPKQRQGTPVRAAQKMEATDHAAHQVGRDSERLEPDANINHDASNSKKKTKGAARDTNNGKRATGEATDINPFFTFLRHMASDAVKLAKTVLQLPMTTYPVWKWFILVYTGWLCLSYTIAYAVYRGEEALAATVCPIPIVGSQFAFCRATTAPGPPTPFNVGKVATAQDGLAVTIDRVGRNHHLAWQMVDRQFAVRDLMIRVRFSKLKEKEDLERYMKPLIDQMGTAADSLSRFTARVGAAVDGMRVFDGYILRELAKRPSLPQPSSPFESPSRAIAAISPFAALSAFQVLATENHVKALISALIRNTDKRISGLINRAREIVTEVEEIQGNLDNIQETVGSEFGNLEPNSGALRTLWVRLVRPGDMKYLDGSHELLLNDMVAFYAAASAVMRNTLVALVRARNELAEFQFGSGEIKAVLVEEPVELIANTLRESIKRLDDGHQNFRAEWDAWRAEKMGLVRGLPDADR